MADRGECSSCKADVLWARTKNAKRMPLDPEPTPDGNVLLGMVGGEEIAAVLGPADRAGAQVDGIPLYTSHFASCPNAAEHRR